MCIKAFTCIVEDSKDVLVIQVKPPSWRDVHITSDTPNEIIFKKIA